MGLPQKGVRKRGCTSLIDVCSRLSVFACVWARMSVFWVGEGPPAEPRREVFPWNFSSFAVQGHGNLGLKFSLKFSCSECPSKTKPKTSWKTSRQTSRKASPRTAPSKTETSPKTSLSAETLLGEGKWGRKKYRRIPKCEGD